MVRNIRNKRKSYVLSSTDDEGTVDRNDESMYDSTFAPEETPSETDDDGTEMHSNHIPTKHNSAHQSRMKNIQKSKMTGKNRKRSERDNESELSNEESDHDDVRNLPKKWQKNGHDGRQTSTHTARKGERSRQKTNRFGNRESSINFDSFFTNLAEKRSYSQRSSIQSQLPGTSAIEVDRSIQLVNVSGEKDSIDLSSHEHRSNSNNTEIFEMLLAISKNLQSFETKFDAKIAILQRQISRVEVIMKSRKMPISQSESIPSVETDEAEPFLSGLREVGLPVANIPDLDELEKNLSDAGFATNAVMFVFSFARFWKIEFNFQIFSLKQFNALSKINGTSGDLDGKKIIASVVYSMVTPELLSKFTMTGKTSMKNVSKAKFKTYVNTINSMWRVINIADSMYTKAQFEHDLTYKVIKYAYKLR